MNGHPRRRRAPRHRRDGRADRPGARHHLLLPIEAVNSGGTTYRQRRSDFTDLAGPPRHDERGDRHHRLKCDPQRLGQRGGRLDDGHLLLQHLEHDGQLRGGTVTIGERVHPDGDGHHGHRRDGGAHRSDAQHRVLLPDQGGQQLSAPPTARCSTSRPRWPRPPRPARRAAPPRPLSTLNGSVNAENLSTTVTFCYSTTTLTNCTGGTVNTVNVHPRPRRAPRPPPRRPR